jgi:hypothetical protein
MNIMVQITVHEKMKCTNVEVGNVGVVTSPNGHSILKKDLK